MVYMIIEVIHIKYCPKSCLRLSVDDQRFVKEKYSAGFNSAIADKNPAEITRYTVDFGSRVDGLFYFSQIMVFQLTADMEAPIDFKEG